MKIVCGCPIAARAWALPLWFECLAKQTRRPDELVFVHSGKIWDDTWRAIGDLSEQHDFPVRVTHLGSSWHPRHDNDRFKTLAVLRNVLLRRARSAGADLFLSLDSDIMLETDVIIEQLLELMESSECDIASPCTLLHPAASKPDSDVDVCWAYNAAWWYSRPGDPHTEQHDWMWDHRPWKRPSPDHIPWAGPPQKIDIPMAVWLGNQRAMECRYRWHYQGEDVGYAQNMEAAGLTALWDPTLRCRHVWCEADMRTAA